MKIMPKGFFITGTDTGVGKTIVTGALVKSAQFLGFMTVGMKPVETGCTKTAGSGQDREFRNDSLIPSDGKFLREISGTEASLDLITPVRFENPLAPLPASEIEGIPVDIRKITDAFVTLSQKYDVFIIEGVGGILVPITEGYSVIDMARDFGLPVIVVARPGLGTINHTLLTVRYALKEGLSIAGVIINYTQPAEGTIAEQTNPPVLEKICPVPVLGIFPYLNNMDSRAIENAALTNLNLEMIKKYLY
jgi:dethiobiotin synthetase